MAFIAGKPAVVKDVFARMIPEIQARAFTITGVEGVNVLQTVRDRLAELPAGGDWNELKHQIVDDISPWLVNPDADPEERDRQAAAADRRAELLLRTHGFQAYQAAQYNVMERQKDVFPYWQYMTMEDGAVREAHAALDGIVLPADDPFWSAHYPPWDWGCRCQVVPISQDDFEDIRADDEDKAPDEKQIVEGARYKALQNGKLILGPNNIVDVRSPVEKAEGDPKATPFRWHPGDLRIPVDDLKARYDDATWKMFEAFAHRTNIPGLQSDVSIFEWLKGKALPGAAEKPGVPAKKVWPAPKATEPKPTEPKLTENGKMKAPVQPAETYATTLKELGLDKKADWQSSDIQKLMAALKEDNPVRAEDKIMVVKGAAKSGNLSEKNLTAAMQSVVDLLPKDVADMLPALKIHVSESLGKDIAGSYNQFTRTLSISKDAVGSSPAKLQKYMWHETMHWVRDHGPEQYKDEIKKLYQKRTVGEPLITEPNTGAKYRKDQFFDWYAGRQYAHELDSLGEGKEVASMHFELFASPIKMAHYANKPECHLKENLETVLSVFFKKS
jgi:SPP1 gp7 family putative phage head morphogenesis protein